MDSSFNEQKRLQKEFLFVKNKILPLKRIEVRLVFEDVPSTMRARWSLFRSYYLIANPQNTSRLNKKQLRGVIAHEMGHIEQLFNMSLIERIFLMFRLSLSSLLPFHFLINQKIRNHERDADMKAIRNGFGKELFALRKLVYSLHSEEDVKIIQEKYSSLEEIKEEIKKLSK